jgi:arginyl-tRNA synthetase
MLMSKIDNKLKILGRKLIGKDFHHLKANLKITYCQNLNYGDYSSNLLFLLAPQLNLPPEKIFENIKNELEKISYIKKVSYLNGYLNIFLNKKEFFSDFKNVLLTPENFLKNDLGKKNKLIIEYVSANPTGPLHIGNGRGAVIGDILAKVLKCSNFKVTKEYYVNDRGNQIDLLVKSVLFYLNKEENNDNFYKGDYLKDFAFLYQKKIEKLDKDKLKDFVVKYILDKLIKTTLKKFGTAFDNFYFETDLYRKNLDREIINILMEKNLLYSHEGALWLNLKKLGETKDEVLIKKNGEQTYFFSDIIYNYDKLFKRNFDYAIIIMGSDHHDHIRRLKKTFELIFKVPPKRLKFIEYQMVNLVKENKILKMSKRKGEFISLQDLIDDVGVEPIRFYFAKYSPEMTINLDVNLIKEESINNQIWYLMYTYARFNSILKKAKERKIKFDLKRHLKTNLGKAFIYLIEQENYLKIFRRIHQFPLVVYDAALNLRPNFIISYLMKLTDELNSFYEKETILTDDPKEVRYKMIFIYYIKKVLDLGFNLLSIKPQESFYKNQSDIISN